MSENGRRPKGTQQAAEWSTGTDARFEEALENSQRGDNYSLLTVLLALVLFLTAMSQSQTSELAFTHLPRPRHRWRCCRRGSSCSLFRSSSDL